MMFKNKASKYVSHIAVWVVLLLLSSYPVLFIDLDYSNEDVDLGNSPATSHYYYSNKNEQPNTASSPLADPVNIKIRPDESAIWLASTFHILTLAFVFYINFYYLYPSFAKNRVFKWYALRISLMIVIVAFVESLIRFKLLSPPEMPSGGLGINIRSLVFYLNATVPMILALAVGSSIRSFRDSLEDRERSRKIKEEKLLAEISNMKLQLSPHFLFNTLNNIRSLIRKRDDTAETMLVRLSELLRYMVYDGGHEKVKVKDEIDYIKNLVDLQKLRIADPSGIHFTYSYDDARQLIEPMLVLPFVENAFKHGVDSEGRPEIKIEMEFKKSELIFSCKNKVISVPGGMQYGGVGLNNVKRRLELLYPDRYSLLITNEESYLVSLKISLNG